MRLVTSRRRAHRERGRTQGGRSAPHREANPCRERGAGPRLCGKTKCSRQGRPGTSGPGHQRKIGARTRRERSAASPTGRQAITPHRNEPGRGSHANELGQAPRRKSNDDRARHARTVGLRVASVPVLRQRAPHRHSGLRRGSAVQRGRSPLSREPRRPLNPGVISWRVCMAPKKRPHALFRGGEVRYSGQSRGISIADSTCNAYKY
jgi:hypothetical protein